MLIHVGMESRDLGDGLELHSVDDDSLRLLSGGLRKHSLVIIPKSKDWFMDHYLLLCNLFETLGSFM
jgi:hypothetical protein